MRATIDTISTRRAIGFTRQLARPSRAITLPSVGMEALAFPSIIAALARTTAALLIGIEGD